MAEPAVAVAEPPATPPSAGRAASATYLVDVEPEAVGRDLRERSQGALPHIDHARSDGGCPVAAGAARASAANIGQWNTAVPMPQPTGSRPRRRICLARPARPAECRRGLGVAFAQRLTNKACRLSVRPPPIRRPEFQRVKPQTRRFVDCRLGAAGPEARPGARWAGRADVLANGLVGRRRDFASHALPAADGFRNRRVTPRLMMRNRFGRRPSPCQSRRHAPRDGRLARTSARQRQFTGRRHAPVRLG